MGKPPSFRPLPNLGECTEADAFDAWSAAHRDHPGFDAEAEECRSCRDARAELNSIRFRELKSQLDRFGLGGPINDGYNATFVSPQDATALDALAALTAQYIRASLTGGDWTPDAQEKHRATGRALLARYEELLAAQARNNK